MQTSLRICWLVPRQMASLEKKEEELVQIVVSKNFATLIMAEPDGNSGMRKNWKSDNSWRLTPISSNFEATYG